MCVYIYICMRERESEANQSVGRRRLTNNADAKMGRLAMPARRMIAMQDCSSTAVTKKLKVHLLL